MTVQVIGLGKLDAIELKGLLGNVGVRLEEADHSADAAQELGTVALVLLTLSPAIIASITAWAMKSRHRKRLKLKIKSTSSDGQSQEVELDFGESSADALDPRTLEALSKVSGVSVPVLKDAIKAELTKPQATK
jgi:hypothetical protein